MPSLGKKIDSCTFLLYAKYALKLMNKLEYYWEIITHYKKLEDIEIEIENLKNNFQLIFGRDHVHLTGKYRRPPHSFCNLKYKYSTLLPGYIHNLSGYDVCLFIIELRYCKGNILVIQNNEQKCRYFC